MKRRHFIQLSVAAGAATFIQCKNEVKMAVEQSPYLDTMGIQLWTVRNELEKDPLATLQSIKNAGYKQIETMNLDQLETLKPIAKDLDLDILCSHFNWTVLTGRWDLKQMDDPGLTPEHFVERAHKHGLEHLIFAYWFKDERQSLDDYKKIAERMNHMGELCNTANISFGYHNHSFEFEPMEGSSGFDVLLERIDSDKMKFELDVFWASMGGKEPTALMDQMGNKINLLHLKDRKQSDVTIYDEGKIPKDAFQEVGDGMLDFKSILAKAEQYGIHYCHVEQDESPNALVSIKESMDALQVL